MNIYLTRRNENVKWAREVLVETFTQFLSASFEAKNAVKAAARLALDDPASSEIGRLRDEAARAEAEMRELQTRMRLLTTSTVIESAQALRLGVKDYVASLDVPEGITAHNDKAMRVDLWLRRDAFTSAVKKTLSL
ncbi:hypothetical protein [Paractinoplanes brasiliensis]|uniref:hypothetical protein n=1 Tax=Paractinoplanes brasiliensis TaxID=52695 RepID=UPI0010621D6F|nr:hypothetical protein [Actinoplanes brasiliensis]